MDDAGNPYDTLRIIVSMSWAPAKKKKENCHHNMNYTRGATISLFFFQFLRILYFLFSIW